MFDIGFSEILVIAIVALIVIGPERLPKAARTLGHLFGRMQRYVNDVKADITREMEIEELRKLQASMQETAHSIESSINKEISTAQTVLNDVTSAVEDVRPPAPPYSTESGATQETPSAASSPQLELGLDSAKSRGATPG